jgi:holin-like protein
MLKAITTLFVCLVAGNAINQFSGLPLPGAVIGLLILLAFLIVSRGPSEPLKQASDFLLQNLTLLFIPASLGVITQFATLKQDALPIGIAIAGSTVLGMAVTALIMQWLTRGRNGQHDTGSQDQK